LRSQIKQALLEAQSVFVVSHALAEKTFELGIPSRKVHVQRNGVDAVRFAPTDSLTARRVVQLAPEATWVLYIGNLVPEKGPDVLIDAIGTLHRQGHVDVRALFIGAGPLLPSLKRRAAALSVGPSVHFAGSKPNAEIPTWLGAADLLCLPSRTEGCPNVAVEAIASGRPVVAAAVGGVPELISQRNGLLVPPDDADALANAILDVTGRIWDPNDIRASLPLVSWKDMAEKIYAAIRPAIRTKRLPDPILQ
jgi:glycosyltransferase involved in cell wall biosynthesis